jgi:hypothetical protein
MIRFLILTKTLNPMTKRLFMLIEISLILSVVSLGQDKKAEKQTASKAKKEAEIAAKQAKFEKAVAAINAKDFVIFVDMTGTTTKINRDPTNFLSYEKEFVFLQGIAAANSYTNKLKVTGYSQTTDKNGNINISMFVRGFYIDQKVEIFLKKGDDWAEVIMTPGNDGYHRFSGELLPREQSGYFKRPNEV